MWMTLTYLIVVYTYFKGTMFSWHLSFKTVAEKAVSYFKEIKMRVWFCLLLHKTGVIKLRFEADVDSQKNK